MLVSAELAVLKLLFSLSRLIKQEHYCPRYKMLKALSVSFPTFFNHGLF